MPRRGLALGGVVTAGLVLATLAFAQPHPRPGRPVPGKPRASAGSAADASEARSAPSAAASASPPPASADAGPVPPPPAPAGSGGPLSPLNPAPNEFSDGGAPPTTIDYDRLLADVAALRARIAAVGDTMYRTKIAISLETRGDHGRIAGLSVLLDDGVVWTAPASFRADDTTRIYEHSVAPGHHAVTVEVERRDDRDDTFRSTQRSRFVVDIPADRSLAVSFKLRDDSNIGGDFRSDRKGEYDLRVRMRAQAYEPGK